MTQNTIKSTFSFLSVTNSKKRVGCIERGLNLQKLIRGSKPWLSAMESRGGSPLPGIRSHSTIWILVLQLNCLSLLSKSPVLKAVYRVSLFLFFPIWDLCFQNPFPEYSSFLFIFRNLFFCLTARQYLCLTGRHWCSSLPWIIIRSQVPDWIRISRTKVQPLEWIGYLVSRRLATRTEVKVAARRRWINGGNRGKGNRSSDREEWDRQTARPLESERDRHHSLQRVRRILLPSES